MDFASNSTNSFQAPSRLIENDQHQIPVLTVYNMFSLVDFYS